MDAAKLNRRLRFETRAVAEDGFGNDRTSAWEVQFTCWANVAWRRGGEGVLAARLEARAPAVVTVRAVPITRRIEPDWRAVDEADGTVLAVREHPQESANAQFLTLLVERGVAA